MLYIIHAEYLMLYYYEMFWRLGDFFSAIPEQMNLEASSSTSPITMTATSPSRPSSQLTFLLLAGDSTHRQTHKEIIWVILKH